MAQKIWEWNKFYGLLGDYGTIISSSDTTKFGKESFGVDGRSSPEGIKMGPYSSTAEYLVSGNITAYLDLAEMGEGILGNSGVLAVTDTGRIYVNGTYKQTCGTTANEKNVEAVSFIGADVYLFSKYGYIHKYTPYTDTVTNNVATFSTIGSIKNVTHKLGSLIYFSTGYNVYTFNGTAVSASPVFVMEKQYKVVGITFWQTYMNFYGKNDVNGIKQLWDPQSGSDAPSFTVPYAGFPILGVDGEGGLDYAVIGKDASYSDLYAIQGTSLPEQVVINTEGNVNARTFNGVIKVRNGMAYLGGTIVGNGCLFSYGNKYPGFPKGLQVEAYTNTLNCILVRSQDIKFGNTKSGDANPQRSGIVQIGDNTGESKYNDVGDVVSLIFTGGKRTLKTFIDCEVCFKTDSLSTYDKNGGQVTLYARTTPSGSWTTIKVINTTTETEGFVMISPQEMGTLSSFNQLEYKLRLESVYDGSRYSISPLITSVTTRYDDNVKGS